jgi:hypothetical protein
MGDPAGEIVRIAAEEGVEMIVLGTHGRSGMTRMLMGSVAEAVVRRATCPVLVYRAAAEKLVALMPSQGRPPALMVALHVWSMTHGIASLFGRGDAARRALPMPPEELLEAAMLIYLRGLGLTTGLPRG